MNKKENLKYQSTHKAIINTTLELLEQKELSRVTVAEICRLAHINRTTFYLHFKDTAEVLDKVAEDVAANISSIFPQGEPRKADFLRLFEFIKKNREFFTLFLRQRLPISTLNRLYPDEPKIPAEVLERCSISRAQVEYHYVMVGACLNAMISCWLERGCEETPEELWEILRQEYGAHGEENIFSAPDC